MLDYNLTLVAMVTRFIISKTEENLGDTTQRKCLFKIQFEIIFVAILGKRAKF